MVITGRIITAIAAVVAPIVITRRIVATVAAVVATVVITGRIIAAISTTVATIVITSGIITAVATAAAAVVITRRIVAAVTATITAVVITRRIITAVTAVAAAVVVRLVAAHGRQQLIALAGAEQEDEGDERCDEEQQTAAHQGPVREVVGPFHGRSCLVPVCVGQRDEGAGAGRDAK
jgi:hypothetical protein